VEDHLPSKCEVLNLSSNLNTAKRDPERQKDRETERD
jgi:hypothetical protein